MTVVDRPGPRARGLVAALAILLVAAAAAGPGGGLFTRAENALLDARLRLAGPQSPPTDLVVAVLDDGALAASGGWPVDRRLWARIVEGATAAGARTIVLDTIFSPEASRSGDDGEERLAAAMARHGRVLVPTGFGPEDGSIGFAARLAYPVVAGATKPDAGIRLVPPPALLIEAAASLAPSVLTRREEGGPPVLASGVASGPHLVPTLAVEAVRLHRGIPRTRLWYDARVGALLDGQPLAAADGGAYLLRTYGPAGAIRSVPAMDVANGGIALEGSLLVVGVDAAATGERFATAFTASLSGVEMLATGIGNLLEGETIVRLPAMSAGGVALTGLGALASALLVGRGRPSVAVATLLGLAGLLLATAQLGFVAWNLWLPLAMPLAALLTAGVAIEAWRLVLVQRAERELAFERRNLARFFSPAVVDRLAGTTSLDRFDRTLEATVMFVDVVGSTAVLEPLSPAAAMAELRRVSAKIEAAVFAEDGTLVSFTGDGAFVVFGAPEPRADARSAALRAAWRLVVDFADDALTISIGLHHGPVLAGNVGGARQFQFSVVGDTVHLASRLEALTRHLEATIVASRMVLDGAGNSEPVSGFRHVTAMPIRGRAQPVDLAYLPR